MIAKRKMRLLTVVGVRPQFVKAAVVSRAIAAWNRQHEAAAVVEEAILHTGQHYDPMMSQIFFDEMDIPPPVVNLQIGPQNGHGAATAAMLARIEQELVARRPDCVLVYGDTNSTLAGALAAAKLHIPVVHAEAGLRSWNRHMPEEINRVLVDHLAEVLFCPSEQARDNLAREGVTAGVHVVGDVMYDAVLHFRIKAIVPPVAGPFGLCTLHRAENTDDPQRLRDIFAALEESPIPMLVPLHPRTRKTMQREGIAAGGQVTLLEPLSYFAMLGYLQRCCFVVTDSGGVQKEAYFLGKRCITVRDETEWTELVSCGANRLVGADAPAICSTFSWAAEPLPSGLQLYGSGDAGRRIVEILVQELVREPLLEWAAPT